MASELDELREKLKEIDSKYYLNLDEKALTTTNNEITKQVIRDCLRKSEEYFQKGTLEDSAYGITYRKMAKDLMNTL
jgi:hypothetical protein